MEEDCTLLQMVIKIKSEKFCKKKICFENVKFKENYKHVTL